MSITKIFKKFFQVAEIYTPKESPWKINNFVCWILFDSIVSFWNQSLYWTNFFFFFEYQWINFVIKSIKVRFPAEKKISRQLSAHRRLNRFRPGTLGGGCWQQSEHDWLVKYELYTLFRFDSDEILQINVVDFLSGFNKSLIKSDPKC